MCTADDNKPVDIATLRIMADQLRQYLDSRNIGVGN